MDSGNHYTQQDVLDGNYTPVTGDLIFCSKTNESDPQTHVGIVTGYDPETKTVYTIEGNVGDDEVKEKSYILGGEGNWWKYFAFGSNAK